MRFDIWILFFVAIVPLLMIGAGYVMWKHCPSEVNYLFGYRTRLSMKNLDTWNFAHDYCGRLWWKMGWILLVVSVAGMIPFMNLSASTIGNISTIVIIIQTVLLVLACIPVEIALRKHFNLDGTRKM